MFLARIKLCTVEKAQCQTQAEMCLKVLFGWLIEDLSYCQVIGEHRPDHCQYFPKLCCSILDFCPCMYIYFKKEETTFSVISFLSSLSWFLFSHEVVKFGNPVV